MAGAKLQLPLPKGGGQTLSVGPGGQCGFACDIAGASMWPLIYFVIFGILLSRVAADCDCASLDSCALNAACIVGRDRIIQHYSNCN